jgi:hypothetical protein
MASDWSALHVARTSQADSHQPTWIIVISTIRQSAILSLFFIEKCTLGPGPLPAFRSNTSHLALKCLPLWNQELPTLVRILSHLGPYAVMPPCQRSRKRTGSNGSLGWRTSKLSVTGSFGPCRSDGRPVSWRYHTAMKVLSQKSQRERAFSCRREKRCVSPVSAAYGLTRRSVSLKVSESQSPSDYCPRRQLPVTRKTMVTDRFHRFSCADWLTARAGWCVPCDPGKRSSFHEHARGEGWRCDGSFDRER